MNITWKIDPAYLRYVYDNLSNGQLKKNDISGLPAGIIGAYDRLFEPEYPVHKRQEDLIVFTFFALFTKPVQLIDFISICKFEKNYIYDFISNNSKYFTQNIDGSVALYHEKFIVYILAKIGYKEIYECNKIILDSLESYRESPWKNQQIGKHYAIANEYDKLFLHLNNHIDSCFSDWWIRDMNIFLNYLNDSNNEFSNYDTLCDILRTILNPNLLKKGANILVKNAERINWQTLNGFKDTSRLEFDIAIEFSKNTDKIPKDWIQIANDETQPLSYLYSYVWKYLQFRTENQIDFENIQKFWFECSPYHKIIVIMIWGYRSLSIDEPDWFSELWNNDTQIPYLKIDYKTWEKAIYAKKNHLYVDEFEKIKTSIPIKFHYIFDDYWKLFEYLDQLNEDVEDIYMLNEALQIAYWIYNSPVWEISNLANKIVLLRLKIKKFRKETINWIIYNLKNENFYSFAQLVFQIKNYLDSNEDFLSLCILVSRSTCSHLRASFIVDLSLFFETTNNTDFFIFVKNNILPILISKADDMWETQEMVNLITIFQNKYNMSEEEIDNLFKNHPILCKIDNPLQLSENDLISKCIEVIIHH